MSRDPERAVLADDQAEQAVAAGGGPIRARVVGVDAARDEALDAPVGVDDPEGRVLRADERADAVDDHLQDLVDGSRPAIAAVGRVERLDDVGWPAPRIRPAVRSRSTTRTVADAFDVAMAAAGDEAGPTGTRDRAHGPSPTSPPIRSHLPTWNIGLSPTGYGRPRAACDRPGPGSSIEASTEAIPSAGRRVCELAVISVLEPRNLRLPGGRVRRVDQERDRLTAGAQSIVRRARTPASRRRT